MELKRETKKTNYKKQSTILAVGFVAAQLIALLTRIPFTNMIGDEGNGFLSAAYGIFTIFLLLSSACFPTAAARLIAARMARGQFKNANRVWRTALLSACILGVIAGGLVFALADLLTAKVMLEPMSAFGLQALAPAIFMLAIVQVLRGYFQGMGTSVPTAVSQVLEQSIASVTGILATLWFVDYGVKVGALLHQESFLASYGIVGIAVGIFVGALFSLLFLFVVYRAFHRNAQRQQSKDVTNSKETYGQLIGILFLTLLPILLIAVLTQLTQVIDQFIFNRIMSVKGLAASMTVQFGVYSGKYKVLTGIPLVLAGYLCIPIAPMLRAAAGKLSNQQLGAKAVSRVRMAMILVIPIAVFLAVLALPLVTWLFQGELALAAKLLRIGTISLVFYTLCMLSASILQGLGRTTRLIIHAVIALLVHLISLILMMDRLNLGIQAVVFADILFAAVFFFLNQIAVCKCLQYKQELLRTFLLPSGASAVMGIMIFLIHKALESPLGNGTALLISAILGFVVYLILILLFRAANQKEWLLLPGGSIVVKIGRLLHFFLPLP